MTKFKIKKLIRPTLIALSTCLLAVACWGYGFSSDSAQASESFLQKYAKTLPTYTRASKVPKAITAKLNHAIPGHASWKNSYPFGQCTWYAYGRAKTNGRKYAAMEGDGGSWYKNVSNYGVTTHTTGNDTPVPQVAVSMQNTYSDLYKSPYNWGFTTHVEYCEYIDSKGYALFSGSNINGATGDVFVHIVTPDQLKNHGLKYVRPLNAKSLKDYGKNPDGSGSGSSSSNNKKKSNDNGDSDDSDSNTVNPNLAPPDNTFTVNGYGSIEQKDWNEVAIDGKLPNKQMLDGLDRNQKVMLSQWVADYGNNGSAKVVSIIRSGISLIGFLVLIFTLFLALAYSIDRLGLLDFGMVDLLTSGHFKTVYDEESMQDMKGTPTKGFNLRTLIMFGILAAVLFVLVITGQAYYLAYQLYYFAYNIINYANNTRPQVDTIISIISNLLIK